MSPQSEVASLLEARAKVDVRRIGIAQRVFSFPVMIGALLVVLMVLTVRGRFNDPDMWWHLKVGEIIWNTHSIPTSDQFSFTTNNHAWIPHEWLGEVTIYGAYKLGGYSGLMALLCLFPSLLIIASYTLCSMYSGNAKVALLGGLATWICASVGLSIRPHLIGYLLLTCELLIVHLGRTRNPRWFWLLVPMFVVWVNFHGSFVFGLMVVAVFLICSFMEFRLGLLVCKRWTENARNTLAVAAVLSVGALFVNPLGVKLVTYPFNVMFSQSVNLAAVDEWQPLRFDEGRDIVFLLIASLVILLPLLRNCDLRLEELTIVALGFGMAIRHTRMLFVFGILAAPIVSRLLSDAWDNYEITRDRIALNFVMLFFAACTVVFAFPASAELIGQVEKGNPTKAVEFLRRSGKRGKMLNEYAYGGYLIWALPEIKVFIDGRTDIFDWTGVLREYGNWATLREDPELLLSKYGIDFCLLSAQAPMSRVLPYLPGWKIVYSDEISLIFERVR